MLLHAMASVARISPERSVSPFQGMALKNWYLRSRFGAECLKLKPFSLLRSNNTYIPSLGAIRSRVFTSYDVVGLQQTAVNG